MRVPKIKEKKVVVTGCSTGIGEATARVLKEAGWQVLPTARKPEDLQRLEQAGFTPVQLDVADSDSIKQAVEAIRSHFGGSLGGLVNNAGFGQPGAVEDLSRDAMRYQFEVNLFGMQELTNHFIPVFREQGWGRIINVSSVVGRLSLPFMGIYSASKFAMEALSDALRVELRSTGIGVVLVEPGPIESAFRERAVAEAEAGLDMDGSHFRALYDQEMRQRKLSRPEQRAFMLPPEAVAEKIRHGLESTRPKTRYKVTFPAYLGAFLSRFAPDSVIDRMMLKRLEARSK